MTNSRLVQPSFDTATDTINDVVKVDLVRRSRSASTLRFVVVWLTYTWSFCRFAGGATVKIFSSDKNMKSTADVGN